jgi:hypothetical protein
MVLTYSPSRLAGGFSSTSVPKNYFTYTELSLNLLSVTAKAGIMFFRLERQTRLSALCRGLVARRMRRPASALRKKTGGKGGKGANPETPEKSMGCRRANRWRKLAETGGNPQDDRYGEPTVPTLDLTQS